MNMKKNIFIIVCIILAVTCLFSGCSKVETTDTKGEENVSLKNEGENYPFEIITSKDIIEAEIIMEDGGVIKLDLYPEIAPITVSNFVYLANEKFYDGLIFHRVIEGFMIQGGCPNGIGTGGPNYRIKGEFTANGVENTLAHTRGVVSMARSSSMDSAGSQFFIMHMDASHLDGQYAAFGRVTEGMEVVDKIATCETDSNDKPVKDIVIKTIKINKKSSEEPVKEENKEEKKVNADKDKTESVTLKDGKEKAEEKTSITEDKNAETKKTESKVTEEKKTEDKKSENKVTEEKKTEDKKSENKVTEDKKTEDKKSENKVTEDKKTEDKKTENKATEDKKTEDKKTENKVTEDKKTQDKKNDEKSVNNENKKEETSKKDGKTEEKVKSDVEKAAEDLGIDLDNMPLTTFELTD